MGASADVDGMLCPFGASVRGESEVDGLATAVHTNTAPTIPNPTAIKTLTSRLGCQRDELNTSFDPLVDGGRDKASAQPAERL
jgi:hypothetical protein